MDENRFLPRPLIQTLFGEGHTGTFSASFDACIASVDVSMFSAYADEVERTGRGAERLGATMRSILDPIIAEIEAHQGSVVSFGGDSLTALWPLDNDGEQTVNAAVTASAIAQRSGLGETGLRLRVGLAAGRVELLDLGGAGSRRYLIPAGDPVTQAVRAQESASMGSVAVTPEIVSLAPSGCEFAGRGGENSVLVDCTHTTHRSPPVKLRVSGGDRYVAFDLAELATEEIRPVSAVFAHVKDAQSNAAEIIALVDQVFAEGGSRLHQAAIIGGDLSALSFFGLPGHAHRDDADRAVRAAMALGRSMADVEAAFGIGVGSGRAFCGPVGTEDTGVYAVLGTALNRAARLAMLAESAVAVDTDSKDAASAFTYSREHTQRVRSLAEPLSYFRPIGTVATPQKRAGFSSPLLGRNKELEQLAHQLGAATSGAGSAVVIEGVSGVGKTALLAEIEVAAHREGMAVVTAKCDERDRVKPYAALRSVLRDLAGLDPTAPASEHHERLGERFAEEVQDPGWLSLLNEPLGVAFPRTAQVKEMTSTDRHEVLQTMLLSLFRRDRDSPVAAILVDDAHWLDRSSWALIRAVLRQVDRLIFVIAAQSEYADPEVAALREAIEVSGGQAQAGRYIRLHALAASDVAALAAAEFGVSSVPNEISEYLHDMTGGHPLLVIELAHALLARGVVSIAGKSVELLQPDELPIAAFESSLAGSEDIPIRVQQLITARLDRLSAPDRRVLQVAARLFRGDFSLEELAAVLGIADRDTSELSSRLRGLEELGLIRQRRHDRWDFDHRMTRVAASNLASDEDETVLHGELVAWLMQSTDPDYSRLAYHSIQAGQFESGIEFLDAAGSMALLGGSPLEAIEHFDQLLRLIDHDEFGVGITRTRLAHWEIQLAEAESAAGRRSESEARFRSALARLGQPLPTGAGVAVRLVYEALRQILHRRGWVRLKLVEPDGEEALAVAQAARAAGLLGQVYYFEERLAAWFMTVLVSVNLSERIRDPGVAALGYSGLASVVGILQTLPGLGSLNQTVEHYLERARDRTLTNVYPESVAGVVDELRPAEDSHHRATADVAAAVYRLSVGRRPDGGAALAIVDAENGVRLSRSLGGFDAIAASLAVYSFAHLLGGRQDVAAKAIDELGSIAERSGNAQYLAWHHMLKAPIAYTMNQLDEVSASARHLREAAAYSGADGVSQGVMRAARLLADVSDPKISFERGELCDLAEDALRHLGASPVFLHFTGYDMMLAALALGGARVDPEERSRIARVRTRTLRRLKRYSRRQPFATGLLALHRGLALEQQGKRDAARASFHEALEYASASELTLIEGRALAGLARTSVGRDAHGYRERAKASMLENGATRYLEELIDGATDAA